MKTTFLMIFIAIITLTPIVIISIKHADGSISSNLYEKGLVYDKNNSILNTTDIKWGDIKCDGTLCLINVRITPLPDTDNVSIVISRPVSPTVLTVAVDKTREGWTTKFNKYGSGWYTATVGYQQRGIPVETETSFYMQ